MFKDQEELMKIGAYLAHLDQLLFFAELEEDPKEAGRREAQGWDRGCSACIVFVLF